MHFYTQTKPTSPYRFNQTVIGDHVLSEIYTCQVRWVLVAVVDDLQIRTHEYNSLKLGSDSRRIEGNCLK